MGLPSLYLPGQVHPNPALLWYLLGVYRSITVSDYVGAANSLLDQGATGVQVIARPNDWTPEAIAFIVDGKLWVIWSGTNTPEQWVGNIFGAAGTTALLGGNVHNFFASIYNASAAARWLPLAASAPGGNIVLFGHSLGGAVATLVGEGMKAEDGTRNITVLTTGAPRVFAVGKVPTVNASHRFALLYDPVSRIPVTHMSLWGGLQAGYFSNIVPFSHIGTGWLIATNGQIVPGDPIVPLSTLQALAEAGNPGYWHSTNTYQTAFNAAVPGRNVQAQYNAAALDVLPSSPATGWPTKIENGAMQNPDIRPIVPASQINAQVFGGAPVVPSAGPFTLTVVDADPPAFTLSQTATPTSGGALVPGPSNLWEITINYQFRKRTFSERWYANNPTTDAQAVLAGFTPLNCAGLLAFRPGGAVLWNVRATMHLNPQYGGTKFCNFPSTVPGASDPAQVGNAVLCVQRGTGGRSCQRMVRCWLDNEIEEDTNGVPINPGMIQGHLNGYKNAILNCLPGAGMRFRERRTKNPNNYFPVQTLNGLPNQQTEIVLLPGDFAALTATGYTGEILLFGKKDRNLFGIRGVYYAISASSPSIIVNYEIPNYSVPLNPTNLFIRRVVYNVDPLSALELEDIRTRKTADPLDRVRGRGVKVATRFTRG